MQGLLLVDKPAGWTSFDVVNYVRKIVAQAEGKKPKNVKVGHTGTLDPFATGLLVVLVGKEYTRRAQELTKLDKTYEVTMRLGQTSSTGDPEGVVTDTSADIPERSKVEQVLQTFLGDIMQTPPAFSAIKIDGKRAYDLARAGKEVRLEPRPVTINSIQLIDYEYPDVRFSADVSSGTYIRTLVEDVGSQLGVGAHTVALRRTSVGKFSVDVALQVPDLTAEVLEQAFTTFS